MAKIARCQYCGSIWVCWNWMHVDRKTLERLNPHLPPDEIKEWGHECWDCEAAQETHKKVKNGIPYWVLKYFYRPGKWISTKLKIIQRNADEEK